MVTDGTGSLQVVASSSERSRLLELLELQNRDGPCLDAFISGQPVSSPDLEAEAEQLQTALTSRVRLEQAKGMIAERHSLDIDTAFELLRTYARSNHRQISDVALSVVRDNFDVGG